MQVWAGAYPCHSVITIQLKPTVDVGEASENEAGDAPIKIAALLPLGYAVSSSF